MNDYAGAVFGVRSTRGVDWGAPLGVPPPVTVKDGQTLSKRCVVRGPHMFEEN
jgi:hypothetical protein